MYIKVMLVASPNKYEHKRDLCEVFAYLAANGIIFNKEKCVLIHAVSDAKICPLPDRVAAIRERPMPRTKTEFQQWLGSLTSTGGSALGWL